MAERIGFSSLPRLCLFALGTAVVLLASLGIQIEDLLIRAWGLTIGFALIAGSLAGASRKTVVPATLAVILMVFAGFSAVVAVPETPEDAAVRAETLSKEQVEASTPAKGFTSTGTEASFDYAARVTGLAGLAMIFGALLAAAFTAIPPERRKRQNHRIERVGRTLVMIGFAGVAFALLRFALTELPSDDLADSFKSFWIGGTWLLLIGAFAIPGFALWAQGMIARGAGWREFLPLLIFTGVYLGLLIPTGQRGFLIALGVMLIAILIGNRYIRIRGLTALIVIGVLLVGLSQGARNEASETGKITAGGFLERIQPDRWRDLFASQIASFNWTMLVEENREELRISNSFIGLLEKPVPRSIYPDKSQGFGNEFTARVFPDAAAQQVSFATPLVAESDYNFGPAGAILILAIVGAFAMWADSRIARRTPAAVEPVVVATIFWVCFELVRGDLANAITFSFGWVAPLVIFSMALGLRRQPRPDTLLIEALPAAPHFSGIGRRIAEIGHSLKSSQFGGEVKLEVRCPADVVEDLRGHFPEDTRFRTPLASSRPRARRILYQQLIAPFRTGPSTVVLCPADQAPFWGRSPLIFVIHDVRRLAAPETAGSFAERRFYRFVMRAGAIRATHIITISNFSRKEIGSHLRASSPISLVSEQPDGTQPVLESTLRENSRQFLVVGALRPYKGLETLLQALAEDGPPVRVLCVGSDEGDSGYADRLRELAAATSDRRKLEMLGWVSDEELSRLRRASAGSISPSTYEGYDLSVTESLAAGLPVILSDIPPHRETAGEAGLYFEPGDHQTLAGLINELALDDDLRIRQAARARSRHQELVAADRSWALAIADALATVESEADGDQRRETWSITSRGGG